MIESIKTFFVILFFSKTILLTPQPLDLGPAWTEVRLDAPLVAITPGAALYADIGDLGAGLGDYDELQRQYAPGLLTARLIDAGGKETVLTYTNGIAFGKDESGTATQRLILQATGGGVPIEREFKRLLIRSDRVLSGVNVTWQNYSK